MQALFSSCLKSKAIEIAPIAKQLLTPLDDGGIVQVLDALPKRPLLAGEESLRLSLAGAQSKVPIVLIGEQIALPLPGQATTHILKLPIARFEGTTENEAFVMRLPATIGLDVAPVERRSVEGRSFLLVERYDRARDERGVVHRIHQEDFCQALGVPPETNYASEAALLSRTASSYCDECRRALELMCLSYWTPRSSTWLSETLTPTTRISRSPTTIRDREWPPFYDLLSTIAYPDLHRKWP